MIYFGLFCFAISLVGLRYSYLMIHESFEPQTRVRGIAPYFLYALCLLLMFAGIALTFIDSWRILFR